HLNDIESTLCLELLEIAVDQIEGERKLCILLIPLQQCSRSLHNSIAGDPFCQTFGETATYGLIADPKTTDIDSSEVLTRLRHFVGICSEHPVIISCVRKRIIVRT